jgi:hypothetical protein
MSTGNFKAENTVKVNGKIRWCNFVTPNEDGKYDFKLCLLSKEDKEALEAVGITVKEDEKPVSEGGKGFFVGVAHTKPIKLKMEDGSLYTDNVGADTEAEVVLFPYAYSFKGKKGISVKVQSLLITKLVEWRTYDKAEEEGDETPDESVGPDEAPDL